MKRESALKFQLILAVGWKRPSLLRKKSLIVQYIKRNPEQRRENVTIVVSKETGLESVENPKSRTRGTSSRQMLQKQIRKIRMRCFGQQQTQTTRNQLWYIHSGESQHISGREDWMENYRAFPVRRGLARVKKGRSPPGPSDI